MKVHNSNYLSSDFTAKITRFSAILFIKEVLSRDYIFFRSDFCFNFLSQNFFKLNIILRDFLPEFSFLQIYHFNRNFCTCSIIIYGQIFYHLIQVFYRFFIAFSCAFPMLFNLYRKLKFSYIVFFCVPRRSYQLLLPALQGGVNSWDPTSDS